MNPLDEYYNHIIQNGFDIPEPPQTLPKTEEEKASLWAAFGMGVVCGIVFLGVCAILLAFAMFGDKED